MIDLIQDTDILGLKAAVSDLQTRLTTLENRLRDVRLTHNPLEIVRIVARAMDVPLAQILGESRAEKIRWARQVSMLLIRDHLEMSLTAVGDVFAKDHTTVLWACRAVASRLDVDPAAKAQFDQIKATVLDTLR